MTEEDKSIWIITEPVSSDTLRISGDKGNGKWNPPYQEKDGSQAIPVSAEKLQHKMSIFLKNIGYIFSGFERQATQSRVPIKLEEIELSIEINGEGEIRLFGVSGKAASAGAIVLKFKRKEFE
jgi:hypothetical protein